MISKHGPLYIVFFILYTVSFAQDTVFTIQSFKPENIKDGQVILHLSDAFKQFASEAGMIYPVAADGEGDGYNHRMSFSPRWRMRFESPKSFFYSLVRFSLDYRNDKYGGSHVKDDAIPEQPINSFEDYRSQYHEKAGSIFATLIGGRYLVKKWGVLGRSNSIK